MLHCHPQVLHIFPWKSSMVVWKTILYLWRPTMLWLLHLLRVKLCKTYSWEMICKKHIWSYSLDVGPLASMIRRNYQQHFTTYVVSLGDVHGSWISLWKMEGSNRHFNHAYPTKVNISSLSERKKCLWKFLVHMIYHKCGLILKHPKT